MASTAAEVLSPLEMLRSSWVFQTAGASELQALAGHCTVERYLKGTRIARQGLRGAGLMLLSSGLAKGTVASPDGRGDFLITVIWPGDVFGETVVFERQPALGTVTAITNCDILQVPRAPLLETCHKSPAFTLRLMAAACDKLQTTLDLAVSLRFDDVSSRLYRRIAHFARFESECAPEGKAIRVHHGLSQQELADSIGASREALNKIVSAWQRAGLVKWGRGEILLNDPAALARQLPPALRDLPMARPDTGKDAFGRWRVLASRKEPALPRA